MAPKAKTPESGTTKQTGPAHRQHTTEADLRKELRRFVAEHPQGWGHEQWLSLVESVRTRGYPMDDAVQIGRLLEREHLSVKLKGIPGVGQQRIQALIEQYGSIRNLLNTDPSELAQSIKAPHELAERIQGAVAA
jgi:hypothetical protein